MLLRNQGVNDEIKEGIRKYLEANDNEITSLQKFMGCSKSSSKREVHNNTGLPQGTRKTSNKQPNLPFIRTGKGRPNKT